VLVSVDVLGTDTNMNLLNFAVFAVYIAACFCDRRFVQTGLLFHSGILSCMSKLGLCSTV